MEKKISVSLTKEQLDRLMNMISNEMIRCSEDEGENTKEYKELDSIYIKLVKGLNKKGRYYLWQLKNRDGEVTDDNIKEEWK